MVNRCLDIGPVPFVVPGALPIIGLQIPVTEGLVAAHLLGSGADTASVNFAPGSSETRIIGVPTFANGYAELDSNAYLQTDVSETAAMTLFAFAKRKVPATNARFISNYLSSASAGVSLGVNSSAASVVAIVARTGAGFNTATTSDADSSWVAASAAITANDATTTRKSYPAPASGNASAIGARTVNGGGKMRIGSGYAVASISQMSSALIFQRDLSAAEITSLTAWAQQYAAECGLI